MHRNEKVQALVTFTNLHWNALGNYSLVKDDEIYDLMAYHGSNVGLKLYLPLQSGNLDSVGQDDDVLHCVGDLGPDCIMVHLWVY